MEGTLTMVFVQGVPYWTVAANSRVSSAAGISLHPLAF
jgi:hypothetical protein